MECAALALEGITAEDETIVGSIFPPDLLGDGVIRFVDPQVNEPWHMRLPSRPPMGSFSSAHDGQQVGPDLEPTINFTTMSGASPSIRRLSAWQRLWQLRYSRGEWAEAIVGIEAQFEALMWRFLELVLVDHGWRKIDFENAESSDKGWQIRNTTGALRHHLGGKNGDWDCARESFQICWDIRNQIVHRSGQASRALANRAHGATQLYVNLVQERLQDRKTAQAHPIAAAAILGRGVTRATLGRELAESAHLVLTKGPLARIFRRSVVDHGGGVGGVVMVRFWHWGVTSRPGCRLGWGAVSTGRVCWAGRGRGVAGQPGTARARSRVRASWTS